MGVEHVEAWWRTGCGVCQQNKDGEKNKWDFKGKKYSACGEDWRESYSSGCLVMLHQSPGFSNL